MYIYIYISRTGPAPAGPGRPRAGTGPAQVLFIIKYIMFIIKNHINEKSINLNLENFAKNPNPPQNNHLK